MPVEVVAARGKADLREFIRLPNRLYRDSPWYVAPLAFERRRFFDPAHNPFFAHAAVEYFLARAPGGEVVGRVTAHTDANFDAVHGGRTGFFGFLDCVDDPAVARALLGAAEGWLRGRGAERVLGPMNFTTNAEVGTLVAGFEGIPYLMMPWNPPYHGPLIESAGYAKAKDLLAYLITWQGAIPEFIARIGARARRSARISIRHLDMRRFRQELDLVKEIYNAAWAKNWGFVPMTDAEIEHMAAELKPLVDPALVYFVFVEGQPAGFFLGVPDYNLILHKVRGRLLPFGIFRLLAGLLFGRRRLGRLRVLTMGVVEKHRRLGLEAVMIEEIHRQGVPRGYREAEMSWILEDNVAMNAIATRLCGPPYRTYRVYGKEL